MIDWEARQRLDELESKVKKLRGELEGQWAHIRNLEEKLLNPQEYTSGK